MTGRKKPPKKGRNTIVAAGWNSPLAEEPPKPSTWGSFGFNQRYDAEGHAMVDNTVPDDYVPVTSEHPLPEDLQPDEQTRCDRMEMP